MEKLSSIRIPAEVMRKKNIHIGDKVHVDISQLDAIINSLQERGEMFSCYVKMPKGRPLYRW
ncbi:MAG TPA: AbrB/MazE/SpoVT family DNA-binding domain-containing protein [Candidatus Ornithospirochaeta avicola]|uniref:AbrB/MazE/SpoVT family DNA-binding domain-containing protein n=1 Tax=Candidatus Ornithospirochaeta avicola TaxID=2840896 RepID=A0A9D1TP35_9SPIO|nr:AbrB/MazE/SpoVT family DNA-binding domain-containing protein [Candidatus Ornithospirochaeta avicola]